MEDRPFLYLTQPDILDKINIDPRLREAFVNVMEKMDAYFYANGYYKLKDYKKFFCDYLIGKDFSILCNDEPSKIGADGFYRWDKKGIVVDTSCLSSKRLEGVICHEFIHFIVMHDLDPKRHSADIVDGGFFNEAFTQMLTLQIFPGSSAYEPQVKMVTFANLLGNSVNDYSWFLRGFIQGPSRAWLYYRAYANQYFEKFKGKGYRLCEAVEDENYIKAQRYAIETFDKYKKTIGFDEYIELLDNLEERPVKDEEFINCYLADKESSLIRSVYGFASSAEKYLLNQFKNLKRLRSLATEYGDTPVHRFNYHGRSLAVDKDGKIYGNYTSNQRESFSIGHNYNTGVVTVTCNGETISFDLSKLYYINYETAYRKKVEQIKNYFINSPKLDIETLNQFKNASGNVLRIEKFRIPRINSKTSTSVYVAVYEDGIEVLNGFPPLGFKGNYRVADYVGLTSAEPSEACIVSKNNRTLNNGVVYSARDFIFVRSECQKWLVDNLMAVMPDADKQEIFDEYKNSSSYDEGDDLSDAMVYYVRKHFTEFDRDMIHDLYLKILSDYEKVIVSVNNGEVQVSYAFGDYVSFACERQVLVDVEHDAIFNHYFNSFEESKIKDDRIAFVPFDNEGNLFLGTNMNVDATDRILK